MLLAEREAAAKQALLCPKRSFVAHRSSSAPHFYRSLSELHAARVALAPLFIAHAAQVDVHHTHEGP